jgi:hypothetical protein
MKRRETSIAEVEISLDYHITETPNNRRRLKVKAVTGCYAGMLCRYIMQVCYAGFVFEFCV